MNCILYQCVLFMQFLSSEAHPVPNYDFVDTAVSGCGHTHVYLSSCFLLYLLSLFIQRLLESLINTNHDTVTDESTLYQQLNQPLPLTAPTTSSQGTYRIADNFREVKFSL